MGRQLTLLTHCLLCLKETTAKKWGGGNAKIVYERQGAGYSPVAQICDTCLGYMRGANWPPDVYAKLNVDRKVEVEQAEEVPA